MIIRLKDLPAILRSNDYSVDEKMCIIALVVLEVMGVLTSVFLLVTNAGLMIALATFALTVIVVLIFLTTQRLLGWILQGRYIIATLIPIVISAYWIFVDVSNMGTLIWIIFSFVFTSLMIPQDRNAWFIVYDILVFALMLTYGTYALGFGAHAQNLWVEIIFPIFSIFVISISSAIIIMIQRDIMTRNQEQIVASAKAVEESFEKEQALNEELMSSNEDLVDITDRLNRKNIELEDLAEELKRKNENQKNLTNAINHEMRSPLNGVMGSLQLLQEESLTEVQKEYLDNAVISAQLLLDTVNNLLDFSRMESGKFEIVKSDFYLKDIMKSVDASQKNQAQKKNLEYLVMDHIGEDVVVNGDRQHMTQVIINLVNNAIKYTPQGLVKISYQLIENQYTVKITDSGIGISEDGKKLLFQPFNRLDLKKNMDIQGTGLGLSIVKSLVEQQNGTITVQSQYGKGSEFTVTFPVDVVKTESQALENTRKKSGMLDLKDKKIVVVDDTRINLQIFKGLIQKTGAQIDLFADSVQAFEAIQKENYDILFTDYLMPEMDGVDLFHKVRETNKTMPIVMMTGNISLEDVEEYTRIGFDGTIGKPIDKEELIELLGTLLS